MCQQEENNIEIEAVVGVEGENGEVQNAEPQNMVVNIPNYDIYWDRSGKEIFRNPNSEEQNQTFIVKTDKTTSKVYSTDDPLPSVVAGIAKTVAENTEQTLSQQANVTDQQAVNATIAALSVNLVQIENINVLWQMYKIALNDDGAGGTKAINNREYGGQVRIADNSVRPVIGPQGDVQVNNLVTIEFNIGMGDRCWFHTHPSGKWSSTDNQIGTVIGGTTERRWWQQPPSAPDVANAGLRDGSSATNYVFAMSGTKTVYVYSTGGVLAIFPQSGISDVYKKKQQDELKNLKKRRNEEMSSAENKAEKSRIKDDYTEQEKLMKRTHTTENEVHNF